jgi:diaminopimelate epimerase
MHRCGNDVVIVDGPVELTVARVRELCDRQRGIGADGVLVMGAARGRCWPVMIHNADGSLGESCGNGARCVARYLLDRHGGDELELSFPGGDVKARREEPRSRSRSLRRARRGRSRSTARVRIA